MNVFQKVTLESLKKNRTRTIVTIIGILLSTAMMTAITTMVASVLQFAYDVTEYDAGGWHLADTSLTQAEAEELICTGEGLEQGVYAKRLGYARLQEDVNTPFLYVLDGNKEFAELSGMHLLEGRYPEKENEILIPKQLENYWQDFDWKVGDHITLEIGERRGPDGTVLWNDTDRQITNSGTFAETLENTHTTEFTIVGFCQRQPLEMWNGSGTFFAVLTTESSLPAAPQVDSYYRLKHPHDYIFIDEEGIWHQTFVENTANANSCVPNYDLLRLSGFTSIGLLNALKGLAALILVIVGGASIALVYNAFAISVSERTKQFGLLSSLGATKKQLQKMVRFEALAVSAVGIPLGILAGLFGIGVTLHLIGQKFAAALEVEGTGTVLHLVISPAAILAASVCALITVLLSAWIPSRKATQVSAVDAIRQSQEIKLDCKDVKSSRLTMKLFGLSGVLGQKYYHRSHRKYRSTILSLFMSVLLFVTVCTFTDYIGYVGDLQFDADAYDIRFHQYIPTPDTMSEDELEARIRALSEVDDVQTIYSTGIPMCFSDGEENYFEVYFLKEGDWIELLEKNHLDVEQFNDPNHLLAVAAESPLYYDGRQNKYIEGHRFEGRELWMDATLPKFNEEGQLYNEEMRLDIGAVLPELPWYAERDISGASFFLPEWAAQIMGQETTFEHPAFHVKAANHGKAFAQLNELLATLGIQENLFDYSQQKDNSRNLILIVQIFSYGFIALITLIAVANVFNTVSTNIGLRRREFAMLKAVGMGKKMFFQMLAYECFLCTGKALLYGLPASLLTSVLIGKIIGARYVISLRIPWIAIGISVIGIFAIMALTTAYAVQKLKKQNLINMLRNENT